MLYKYRFKNLWSFAEEAEVSFVLNHHTPETDSVFQTPRGVRLSKMMAVQGANGAGKSNVLQVLSFLGWFVRHSFAGDPDDPIMVDSHLLYEDDVSEIAVEFELDGDRYRYRLVIQLLEVVHESLHRKTNTTYRYMFRRDWVQGGYTIRQKDFGFSQKQAERVRSNASLISTASQYNVPGARKLADYFGRISTHSPFYYSQDLSMDMIARFFYEHPELRKKMAKFMSQIDLGLSDVTIEMVSDTNKKPNKKSTWALPYGTHRQGRRSFELPFWAESEGTQTTLMLLQKILPVLEHGGVVVLDELDDGLHPDMVMALLDLFTDTDSNPHHAQIIFTSYIPDVMDTLLKEQILLVEKNDNSSEAWRLDEIQGIRRDDNYYGKYRAGAYGATPDI